MLDVRPQLWTIGLVLLAIACGDNVPDEPDAARPDAGMTDADTTDADTTDADTTDAAMPDADTTDAAELDADVADADVTDAAEPDAAVIDAGVPDADMTDAAVPDAAVPDAAVPDASPDAPDPTCGDGNVDPGEQCDDGAANSDTMPNACRTNCMLPTCGDGTTDPGLGEECDLGAGNSNASGSACFTTCRRLWSFVSIPDFPGFDIGDVSALSTAVNSTNVFHRDAIDVVLDSIAAENPDFVLVAGNLVSGTWHADIDSVSVFGPTGTLDEKAAAVALAGDTYYPQWLERFGMRGIAVHAAVGERDLGGAPWPASFDRSALVDDYKSVWAEHLTTLPGGAPRYMERPVGTDAAGTAYAFRHKNMLVLTADVFRHTEGTDVGPQGTVALDVSAEQLAWMNAVFAAAAADPTIEFLVVQGHVPVIKPVRFQESENLGLDGGRTSAFWQALAAAGVDLYLSGHAHAMTTKGADGVEQVTHGGILGAPQAPTLSYLVGRVYPDRIELELKWIDVTYTADTSLLWQTGARRPRAEVVLDEATGFTTAGTMVLDHAGPMPICRDRTGFFLRFNERPDPGLMVHLPLDAATNGRTANLGFSRALHRGTLFGGSFSAGKLGNALTLAGGDRVTAGQTPLGGTIPRTVALWIKPAATAATLSTPLAFGRNASGAKWDIDIDHVNGGVIELGIGGGRTNSAGSTSVTDGEWHHVALVLPEGGDSLDDVSIYVDGVAITSTASAVAMNTAPELPDQSAGERPLVLGHSANNVSFQQYEGQLDDVAIWSRGLDATEVRAIVSLASTAGLGYDAGQVDALLGAFAAARDVTVGGRAWRYQASGLTGAPGTVIEPTPGAYELNLGGGAGFVSP